MMKLWKTMATALTGMLAFSCGAQFPLLAESAHNRMSDLQELVQYRTISSPAQMKGDSLAGLASDLLQKGKREAAWETSDRATIYYRLALARQDLKNSREEVARLEQALTETEEQLRMYGQVLDEIKQMKPE
jgi:hypothetical protein